MEERIMVWNSSTKQFIYAEEISGVNVHLTPGADPHKVVAELGLEIRSYYWKYTVFPDYYLFNVPVSGIPHTFYLLL